MENLKLEGMPETHKKSRALKPGEIGVSLSEYRRLITLEAKVDILADTLGKFRNTAIAHSTPLMVDVDFVLKGLGKW
jgi:hypothetical protein